MNYSEMSPEEVYDELIRRYHPVAMVSIERCGRNVRGAYGMTAYLQRRTGRRVLPSFGEIRDYLQEIVALRSVDGYAV